MLSLSFFIVHVTKASLFSSVCISTQLRVSLRASTKPCSRIGPLVSSPVVTFFLLTTRLEFIGKSFFDLITAKPFGCFAGTRRLHTPELKTICPPPLVLVSHAPKARRDSLKSSKSSKVEAPLLTSSARGFP